VTLAKAARGSRRTLPWSFIPRWPTAGKRLTPMPAAFRARGSHCKATDPGQLNEGFYFSWAPPASAKGDYAQAEQYLRSVCSSRPNFAEAQELPGLHVGPSAG